MTSISVNSIDVSARVQFQLRPSASFVYLCRALATKRPAHSKAYSRRYVRIVGQRSWRCQEFQPCSGFPAFEHVNGEKMLASKAPWTIGFADGVVRVVIRGFWSKTQAEQFCSELNAVLAEARRQAGEARILVDRRESPVQASDVVELLGANNARLEPDDRVALVVDSQLAQMQLRRVLVHARTELFRDIRSAETWLRA